MHLRHVNASDRDEFLDVMRKSREFHEPWISPPRNNLSFQRYMERIGRDDHEGLVIRRNDDSALVGVININNIVRGSFLSASLGYYANAALQGQGLMSEALGLVKRYAVADLGLHRLEANIQPENTRSIALVKANGFNYEGLSPAFLYIDGQWRDHERWTYLDRRQSLQVGARLRLAAWRSSDERHGER